MKNPSTGEVEEEEIELFSSHNSHGGKLYTYRYS
jgi:2'-5' RNA ligase